MFTPSDIDSYWLTVTNIVLGAATVICILVMGTGLYKDVKARLLARQAVAPAAGDDHAFVIPMLGVTMADGGERLDSPRQNAGEKADEGHIVRSNN